MSSKRQISTRQPSPLARRLLSGVAWAFAVRCLGATSALAANALLARILSPQQLGWYFLLQSIAVFAAVIARFGMRQTVVRMVAGSFARNEPGRARRALTIVYSIVTVCTAAVGAIYYFFVAEWLAFSVFEAPIIASVAGITFIWIASLALQTPVAETFRGLHNIRLATLLDGALANFLLATSLALFWILGTQIGFSEAIMTTAGMAALSVILGSSLLAIHSFPMRGAGTTSVREIITISYPLFVTDMGVQAMSNFSLWIVGAFFLADAVALYGAAWKLVMLVLLPLTLVNMAVQPLISELHERGEKKRLETALRGTATLAGIPGAAVLLVFLLWGGEVLDIAYGPHYKEASTILAILSIGMLADVWSGSCAQLLAYTGHQKQLMYVTLITGAVSALLILLSARFFGALGVAGAVTIGKIIQNFITWLLAHKLVGLWTHVTLSPRFIISAARRVRS